MATFDRGHVDVLELSSRPEQLTQPQPENIYEPNNNTISYEGSFAHCG